MFRLSKAQKITITVKWRERYRSTLRKFFTHLMRCVNESPYLFWNILRIMGDLNHAVIWMVLIFNLISCSRFFFPQNFGDDSMCSNYNSRHRYSRCLVFVFICLTKFKYLQNISLPFIFILGSASGGKST